MLKKELTLPGTKIQIKPVIKSNISNPYHGNPIEPYLSLMADYGSNAAKLSYEPKVFSGDVLEVLIKPKSKNGINCVKVKRIADGVEGFLYWCVIRGSANHI